MALWVCKRCRTAYAVGLRSCPQCTSEDAYREDEEVPNTTVHGGPSYKPNELPENLAEVESEQTGPEAGAKYNDLSKTELQDLLDERDLPISGNKADLVARLEEADTAQAEGDDPDTSGDEG